MAVEAPSISSNDAVLLAEIPPAMLAKLKADSIRKGLSTAFSLTVVGAFVVPSLAKQLGVPGSIVLPSNQLGDWAGLVELLFMIVLIVFGGVTMVRSFVGRPSMLRAELSYRRLHGKWRWER
jgi:hypothetical protein